MSVFIGIDPGESGGIAVIGSSGDVISCVSMPETERDIYEHLGETDPNSFAVIEKVGGFIAGNPAPGSAMFKFGRSYGGLRMALVACCIPFEEHTPQAWQKALGITPRNKDESKSQFKTRLKARAQQLFPGAKITLATADAVLIAEFCRRTQVARTLAK